MLYPTLELFKYLFPLSTCSGIELAHLPATHYSGIPFSLSSPPPLITSFPPHHPFPPPPRTPLPPSPPPPSHNPLPPPPPLPRHTLYFPFRIGSSSQNKANPH